MSYIGRGVDAISNVEKLDNITFNGGTTTDFAPLIKSPVLDKDEVETGEYNYGMRYQELVGVLIKSIQELSAKVKALEG